MPTITVNAPASKSVSHRAVIAGALGWGTSRLSGVLKSQDLERTLSCMAAMGAKVQHDEPDILITGVYGRPIGGSALPPAEPALLDVGESGTTCRLLVAVAAAGRGRFAVRGKGRMHERPIGELTDALATLGAKFTFQGKPGCPPLTIDTDGLAGETVAISLEDSSQYLSGLLLAAPMLPEPLTVEISGKKTVSWPYVAITLAVMADFDLEFVVETNRDGAWTATDWRTLADVAPGQVRFRMQPGRYQPRAYTVEGDWSNASYFLAAGAVGKRPVTVAGLRPDSLQGDRAILDILAKMGARIDSGPNGVTVSPAKLSGQTLDMGRCPDLVPTVAMAAAFATGPTTITGVAHLRLKESDRIAAVAHNLARVGAAVETLPDGLRIEPKPLPTGRTVELSSFDDHRLAMSAALFELASLDVRLDNPGCVAKSFPGFWKEWEKIRKGMK